MKISSNIVEKKEENHQGIILEKDKKEPVQQEVKGSDEKPKTARKKKKITRKKSIKKEKFSFRDFLKAYDNALKSYKELLRTEYRKKSPDSIKKVNDAFQQATEQYQKSKKLGKTPAFKDIERNQRNQLNTEILKEKKRLDELYERFRDIRKKENNKEKSKKYFEEQQKRYNEYLEQFNKNLDQSEKGHKDNLEKEEPKNIGLLYFDILAKTNKRLIDNINQKLTNEPVSEKINYDDYNNSLEMVAENINELKRMSDNLKENPSISSKEIEKMNKIIEEQEKIYDELSNLLKKHLTSEEKEEDKKYDKGTEEKIDKDKNKDEIKQEKVDLDLSYLDYQVNKIAWAASEKKLMDDALENEQSIFNTFNGYLNILNAFEYKDGISNFAKYKLEKYKKEINNYSGNLKNWGEKLSKYKEINKNISDKLKNRAQNDLFSEDTEEKINKIKSQAKENLPKIESAKESAKQAIEENSYATQTLENVLYRDIQYVDMFPTDGSENKGKKILNDTGSVTHKSQSGEEFSSQIKEDKNYTISVKSTKEFHKKNVPWVVLSNHEKTVVDAAVQAMENHPEDKDLYIYTDNVEEAELVYLTARIYGMDKNNIIVKQESQPDKHLKTFDSNKLEKEFSRDYLKKMDKIDKIEELASSRINAICEEIPEESRLLLAAEFGLKAPIEQLKNMPSFKEAKTKFFEHKDTGNKDTRKETEEKLGLDTKQFRINKR